ncbi:MAG: hypothetical protein JWP25_8574 [Bradyrhizobium sp.]|nr:hypothetical protein [Bradyrhizobium sp.]
MTRLILTTDASGAGNLKGARRAEIVIPFEPRFVWGPLPSEAELVMLLARHEAADHWLWNVYRKYLGKIDRNEIGLIDFCERCESIELWIDPVPSAQLTLIWLLGYLRRHEKIASRLTLVQAETRIGENSPRQLARWKPAAIAVTNDHFEIAGLAWQAYRASMPQTWFDLLNKDLSILPQLRACVVELLEELPQRATGLGATEMRMLELIAEGDTSPLDVFPGHLKRNERHVFEYWEVGSLLDGLARCPAPAVAGLDDGPFNEAMHRNRDRRGRYMQSELKLTEFGEAVLAGTEDFSRHNPIDRWWGGTELTNDRLWRWDPANRALIAP